MPTTPNYKETTVAGDSWQRSHHVVIQNPLGGLPSITFGEEKVFVLGDKTIKEFVGQQLSVTFDATNDKHLALYAALNELYTELRDARDTPTPEQAIP